MRLFFYLLFLTLIFQQELEAQHSKVVSAFESIESSPQIIRFTNTFEVNNNGGHLQGIQLLNNNPENYILMSGSSDSYAYTAIIKQRDPDDKVIGINKLMEKPFKHAGGFQIFEKYMAVGIEDNVEKDKSKVCIYDVSSPANLNTKPLAIIVREGAPMRSTAGCVGISEYKNEMLIAVGDWDTKHIDFYSGSLRNAEKSNFKIVCTIDTEKLEKNGWVDKNWYSYQNINLFNINEKLYLVGLGQTPDSENIADLFSLLVDRTGNFVPVKIASKKFNCSNECTFKAGAGIHYENGKFSIISCGYNIKNTTYLNYFSGN